MEDDYDFSQALLPEEIIGIIDQLLCHEVGFLECRREIGLTSFRWPGIKDILSRRQYSLVCISIDYSPHPLLASIRRSLIGAKTPQETSP